MSTQPLQQTVVRSNISAQSPGTNTNQQQVVKNGRTYLVADNPVAAATTATGSTIIRRPANTEKPTDITSRRAVAINNTGVSRNMQNPSSNVATSVNVSRRKGAKLSRICTLCGKDATYLCSGCHTEWYCSRECQVIKK